MLEADNDLELHVFVCTNQKPNKESCVPRGAEKIRADLKDWAKKNPNWHGRIRINSSGCLDRCKEGVAVAIYPQNRWLVNVAPGDLDELKSIITQMMAERGG